MAIFDIFRKSKDVKEAERLASISQFVQSQFTEIGKGSVIWHDVNFKMILEEAYRKNPDVFSVVNFISNKVSDLEYCVYDRKNGEKLESGEAYESFANIKYNPNSYQNFAQLLNNLATNRLVLGNSYAYFKKGETALTSGLVTLLESLPAAYMDVVSGDTSRLVRGYKLNYGDTTREFSSEEVCHIMATQIDYGSGKQLYGQSPLEAAFKSVQTANSSYDSQKYAIDNQGAQGVLYNKGVEYMSGKDTWGVDEVNKAKDMLKKLRKSNASNSIGVAAGDLGYINFGIKPVDMGLVEYLDVALSDICNVYNVDPGLFARSDGSTFNNQREFRKRAYNDAIIPTANELSDAFTDIFCDKDTCIKVDTSSVEELQEDRSDLITSLNTAEFLSTNEKRQYLGLPEMEGEEHDRILVNSSKTPIDLAGYDGSI